MRGDPVDIPLKEDNPVNDTSCYFRENDDEVDLSALFWNVISRWRTILIWTLAFCVLFGAVGGIKLWNQKLSPEELAEQVEEFETTESLNEQTRGRLENQMDMVTRDIQQQYEYTQNAPEMQANPYGLYTITNTYYIARGEGNELETDSRVVALVKGYEARLRALNVSTYLEGTEERDESEYDFGGALLNVDVEQAEAGILIITVFGATQEQAELISAAVDETIESSQVMLSKTICDHTCELLASERSVGKNDTLLNLHRDQYSILGQFGNSYSLLNGVADQYQSSEYSYPSLKASLKTVVKLAIIGAALGFALSAGFYMLKYVLSDVVLDREDLFSHYGIEVLGVNSLPGKDTLLDRVAAKHRGIPHAENCENENHLLAAHIQRAAKGAERVMVIGTRERGALEALVGQLRATGELTSELQICGDIRKEISALHALDGDAPVLCVEEISRSKHKDVREELNLLASMGKGCIGFAMIGRAG